MLLMELPPVAVMAMLSALALVSSVDGFLIICVRCGSVDRLRGNFDANSDILGSNSGMRNGFETHSSCKSRY